MVKAATRQPRNFLCPMTSAACINEWCRRDDCFQQKAEDYFRAPLKNQTRRRVEADGWQLTRVTRKHHHFEHTTKPGIITVPNDDRLLSVRTRKRAGKAEAVRRYLAIVLGKSDSNFGISFPDFPGCITAGHTLDEAKEMAGEALRGHIAAVRAVGLPIPEPSTMAAVTNHRHYPDSVALLVIDAPGEAPAP
jgi:predicted RNase H-like HicB family nuclease